MKDLFSPDSHWHDLGEVKYEPLFPGRLLLQFPQQDDFPKALGKLERVTYLLLPEQQVEQSRLAMPFWRSQMLIEMALVPLRGDFSMSSHLRVTSLMQWSPPRLPGRKGRWWLVSFPSRDRSWTWERASCMPDTRPEGDNQTGEEQDWMVARGALFQKATSAEIQPSDFMEGFSFQILNVCIRGSSSGNC